ncbi:MAG: hydrogenase nickel incorporation protein HypA/HybF [Pseudonocardiales bacterium]|nr:hydrogenase nickel incorporation protein HypA/HybF [Pseudonocardiales bacterium]
MIMPMHELAIAQSVVDAVLDRLPENRVSLVVLQVGKLSGVEPDALRFCFELAVADTALDGAELEIVEPAGLAWCETCRTEFGLSRPILLCACGSADVRVISGDQLLISSVKVA